MNSDSIWIRKGMVSAIGMLCLAVAVPSSGQVQTQTNTTSQASTRQVTVESGVVVVVEGNDLFVKMDDGSIHHFPNIPDSATVTVDGQQLNVHQLKPGMKLQRTTVKTTTNELVTTVQTVTGKVWHVSPPLSVVLTLENGENQTFKIPSGQKFMVDGRETDAWGLKRGMVVNATKLVETPVTRVSQQKIVTGAMPDIPPGQPVLIAKAEPTPAPAAAPTTAAETTPTASAHAPKQLPKTGSDLPLIGLLGFLSISVSLVMRLRRKLQDF